jgi:hypothetical protein
VVGFTSAWEEAIDPVEILTTAANFTATELDGGFPRDSLQSAVNVLGTEAISHLQSDDVPGLFAALVFLFDGKVRTGGVLTVADRAIFVWEQGRLRVKLGAEVVPFSTVTVVKYGTEQVEDFDKPLDTLEFQAAKHWRIAVPASSGEKPKLFPHLAGILES